MMTATRSRRSRSNPRRLQRIAHLVAGAAVALYVYATPSPDSALAEAVRWVLLPALAATGMVMWQWAKIRRRMLDRGSSR